MIYQNFVDLTNIMKSKADQIMIEFQFNLQLPQYYVPDAGLLDTLKACMENKQSNPQSLSKVSQQLRSGMDRQQFNTQAVGSNGNKSSSQQKQKEAEMYSPDNAAIYKFSENDSDSGEDFDYGEEEGEENGADSNLDILQYISNMDVSNLQGGGGGDNNWQAEGPKTTNNV